MIFFFIILISTSCTNIFGSLKKSSNDFCGEMASGESDYCFSESRIHNKEWTPYWSDVVGHWSMDETSWSGGAGEVVSSTGAFSGVAQNGADTVSAGYIGSHSGVFDGVSSYVDLGDLGTLGEKLGEGLTICTWFKTAATNRSALVANYAGYIPLSPSFQIELNRGATINSPGRAYIYMRDGSGLAGRNTLQGYVGDDLGFSDNGWHHLCVSIDVSGKEISLVYDGEVQTVTLAVSQDLSVFSQMQYSVYVGAGNSQGATTEPFSGEMDELIIWNRVVPINDMKKIYLRQSSK